MLERVVVVFVLFLSSRGLGIEGRGVSFILFCFWFCRTNCFILMYG